MPKTYFRMRDLEARTGVGRETIRFYLKEGLLPEPERPKRNVALYSQAHVDRLLTIKRLQEEKFLPLNVIKALLDHDHAQANLNIEAFAGLQADVDRHFSPLPGLIPAREVTEAAGLDETEIEAMAATGLVRPVSDAEGIECLDQRDAAIVRQWALMREAGFSKQRGFRADRFRLHMDFVHWLVGEEIRLFFNELTDEVEAHEAGQMAAVAIPAVNTILSLLRTRVIQEKLGALYALDNPVQHDELKQSNDQQMRQGAGT